MSKTPLHRKGRTPVRLLLAISATAVLAASCGGSTDALESSSSGSDDVGTSDAVALKITEEGNAGALAVGQRDGTFETALEPVGGTVEWVPSLGAFTANLEAMVAGEITVTGGAISPAVGALSKGIDYKIVGVAPGGLVAAGIVAAPGSGITDIEGLKGKRVAVNPAGKGEYLLLKALKDEGIPFDEVERVPIQPAEAAAAFQGGQVDAWSTFGNFYVEAVANGGTVLAKEADLDADDHYVIVAKGSDVEKNPTAFRTFIDSYAALIEEGHTDPEAFQNVFETTGPRAAEGERLAAAIASTKAAPVIRIPTQDDLDSIDRVVELFAEAGVIPSKVAAEDIVYDLGDGTASS